MDIITDYVEDTEQIKPMKVTFLHHASSCYSPCLWKKPCTTSLKDKDLGFAELDEWIPAWLQTNESNPVYEYYAFSPWHYLLWAFLSCAMISILEIKAKLISFKPIK